MLKRKNIAKLLTSIFITTCTESRELFWQKKNSITDAWQYPKFVCESPKKVFSLRKLEYLLKQNRKIYPMHSNICMSERSFQDT